MIKSGKNLQDFMLPDGSMKDVKLPEETQKDLNALKMEVDESEKLSKMEVSQLVQDAQLVIINTHICNENLKGKDGEAIIDAEQVA